MKKLFMIVAILFATTCFAQVTFSSRVVEYCKWNTTLEQYTNCNDYEDFSLFTLNEQNTILYHTVDRKRSAYYVQYLEEISEKKWRLDVISDTGKEYLFILDAPNSEIRVVGTANDDLLIRYYIQTVW